MLISKIRYMTKLFKKEAKYQLVCQYVIIVFKYCEATTIKLDKSNVAMILDQVDESNLNDNPLT